MALVTRITTAYWNDPRAARIESGVRARFTTKGDPDMRTFTRSLLQRIDAYTLWAFNPQPELTSRYERTV